MQSIYGIKAWILLIGLAVSQITTAAESSQQWWSKDGSEEVTINLYFYWSERCSHCQAALPDVQSLAEEYPWLRLYSRQLDGNEDYVREYQQLAASIDETARSVPGFLFCRRMMAGFDTAATTGMVLRRSLQQCHEQILADGLTSASVAQPSNQHQGWIPFLGPVDLSSWSLPAVTLTLALLDSVNPCAFFLLLLLLSVLLNAGSRWRILLVGTLFVLVSGVTYFVFLAAWLNLFQIVGDFTWVSLTAGSLALLLGVINVGAFLAPEKHNLLSIQPGPRQRLFKRIRRMVRVEKGFALISATLALAIAANFYEILCTAGLPMVFTRLLTLQSLTDTEYYGYLLLYCTVYVTPLLLIVIGISITLGHRKLNAHQGRLLKLISGLMMTGLGLLLIVDAKLLSQVSSLLLLILSVFVGSGVILGINRYLTKPSAKK